MSRWYSVLVYMAYHCVLLSRFIMGVGHNHLDSFQVFGWCTNSLDKLQIFALHVLMSFRELIVLESQFEHFLTSCSFSLSRLFPVLFVHGKACLVLCCRWRDSAIVFMDRLDVFLVLLWLFLLVSPQILDFCLVFVLSHAEIANLRVEILNFRGLSLD